MSMLIQNAQKYTEVNERVIKNTGTCWRHLKKTGTNSKYVSFDIINDVTAMQRSCCLVSFGTFREDKTSLF